MGLTWKIDRRKRDRTAVMPDLRVDTSSKDHFSGRDPALEAVLGQAPR